MRFSGSLLVAVALAATSTCLAQPQIKSVAPVQTSPASGVEMYTAYCAVCHGTDGKGRGPAAPALKTIPPDLTQLTVTNEGKFPTLKVQQYIKGDTLAPAHGSRDMPMWGPIFRQVSDHDAEIQLRIRNLTEYIAKLQRP